MSHNHNRAWQALQSTSLSGALRHKPVKAQQGKLVLAKLKAMSASFLSVAQKAYNLLIGDAQIMWQAARRTSGEQHASHLHHSYSCTAAHWLVQFKPAPRGSSSTMGFIGQFRLSMERWQRTQCSLTGVSRHVELLVHGPSPRAMPAQTRVVPAGPAWAAASLQLLELPLS